MQAQTIELPASEIKLGDIYVTQAAFAPIRYREVIGIRPCVGPDEREYVELTLKKDKRAPNGSEASVPADRVVKVRRAGPWPYTHGAYCVREVGVGAGLVIRRKDDDHTRAVAYIDDMGQWERFTAALDSGLDEVAAVHAIDGSEEDPNPTAEACGAPNYPAGSCDRGVGHPGRHRDESGNEWEQ